MDINDILSRSQKAAEKNFIITGESGKLLYRSEQSDISPELKSRNITSHLNQ